MKEEIKKALFKLTERKEISLDVPENGSFGDYSSNIAMQMFSNPKMVLYKFESVDGKEHREKFKNPREFAEQLVAALYNDKNLSKVVEKMEVAGPGFINFFVKNEILYDVLTHNAKQFDTYGKTNLLNGKKYLIEHTSPNPNKAMHLGHLRNNVTGMAIANIWEFLGCKVIRDDIDNNRGIAIAKLMWGYLKFSHKTQNTFGKEQNYNQKTMISYWFEHQNEWFTPQDKNIRPDRFVDELYVKASNDFKDKEVEKQVRNIVVDWEAHDKKNWELWKKVLSYSYEGQAMTLKRLGNKWDKVWHEHEHYQKGKDIVEEGLKKGIFKVGKEGAIVTDLSKYNLSDTLVRKSDGTALYITQDLALTKLKKETFKPDKLFWVIGPEQTLALKQLFAICEQLGIVKNDDCVHIPFGWMSIKGQGKMSSRLGNVVYIDELLDKAKENIKSIMTQSGKNELTSNEIENISEMVGVGAVKYSILKVGRTTDTAFDFDESLSFEGNSGPYLQYTYARTQSVLAKVKGKYTTFKGFSLQGEYSNIDLNLEELEVLRTFIHFPEVVAEAAERFVPNLICTYLYDLAQKYNSFYNKHRILEDKALGTSKLSNSQSAAKKTTNYTQTDLTTNFRLSLTLATGEILKTGLNLLGIKAPEKM